MPKPSSSNKSLMVVATFLVLLFGSQSKAHNDASGVEEPRKLAYFAVSGPEDRDRLLATGFPIDFDEGARVGGITTDEFIRAAEQAGLQKISVESLPPSHDDYHEDAEVMTALDQLVHDHADVAELVSIGKTFEGRDIVAVHVNSSPAERASGQSEKPGVFYVGKHHAREIISSEVVLRMLQHHLERRKSDAEFGRLMDQRDAWYVVALNRDGTIYDLSSPDPMKAWRKNRRDNGRGWVHGVDLNRNYSVGFGGPGSSDRKSSEIYRGAHAFSEPETAAVRDFFAAHPNVRIGISFHSFSKLVLWPNGHTRDPIDDARDLAVFEAIGRAMAEPGGYRPMQASDLYVASGDTGDWAYHHHKDTEGKPAFVWTIELPPSSMGGGGFYPRERAIGPAVEENKRACELVLIYAEDPYRAPGELGNAA